MPRIPLAAPASAVQALFCLRRSNAIDLSAPPHAHEFHQFLYLLAGHCEVTLGSVRHHVPANHLLSIAPGRIHALAFPDPAVTTCDVFQLKCRLNPAVGLPVPPELADCTAHRRQCALAVDLIDQVMTAGPGIATDAAIGGALACLLALAARPAQAGGTAIDPRIALAIEHVRANLDGPISIAHLAALCQLDPSYFCRLFRAGMGQPPQAWITAQRLERACSLLVFSNATTAAIAEAVGYSSGQHFSSCFLRRYGERPGAYRAARLRPGVDQNP